jgi:nitrate reductase NapE component
MVIKFTKHWHYLVAFLVTIFSLAPILNVAESIGGLGFRFIASAILGFLWISILVMWLVFTFSKKGKATE